MRTEYKDIVLIHRLCHRLRVQLGTPAASVFSRSRRSLPRRYPARSAARVPRRRDRRPAGAARQHTSARARR
eukprot:COSAG06_NODE_5579_length_3390_cov_9.053024_1_plen_72_part_00